MKCLYINSYTLITNRFFINFESRPYIFFSMNLSVLLGNRVKKNVIHWSIFLVFTGIPIEQIEEEAGLINVVECVESLSKQDM